MTKFLIFLSAVLLLNGEKEQQIIASYSAISCTCAQWKVEGELENIYLERANEKIKDVNKLWDGSTLPFKVALTGTFKPEKGIPKDFPTKGEPKIAKIFVYTKVAVIKN
ncbi:hypothetical protein [Flavobacterium sp.]|uniref:hypothetical protein n=1 Tax=Flavobacterium sp. TaxID=239 RepID=UPI002636ADFF|nr:hypothetical protein [Flavobacterium sp.]